MNHDVTAREQCQPEFDRLNDEIERLRRINSELVDTHNKMVIHDSRQDDEIKRLRAEIERLKADCAEWRQYVENLNRSTG